MLKRDWNFIETPSLMKPGWKEDGKGQPLFQHLHGYPTQESLVLVFLPPPGSQNPTQNPSLQSWAKMGANPCAGSSAARGQEREVNWVGAGSEERSRMETRKKKMEENPKGR